MWVKTVSMLPRVGAFCANCASPPAFRPQNLVKTNQCDNLGVIRQLTILARRNDLDRTDQNHHQKRFLFAAASGAAETRQFPPSTPPHFDHPSSNPIHSSNSNAPLLGHSENPKELCDDFLANICEDIKSELNTSMPPLRELAHYLFDGHGKYIRPQIVYLIAVTANKTVLRDRGDDAAAAAADAPIINERQMSVCRIAEMIHTASLIHDDVIDGSSVRRGHPTIHSLWGESKAVITGDYILSVASHCLSETKSPEVVQIISQVVEDLVRGEFMQLGTKTDETLRFNHYLEKTYRKTASLLANCCKAAVLLSGSDEARVEAAFQYGRNIGIAFQLVDDLLDFISTDEALGKPAAADLNLGLATAPVLFALDQHPDLAALIVRRFSKSGDVATALECVRSSDGVEQTKFLASKFSAEAMKNLDMFADTNHRRALKTLTDSMLHRLR